MRQLIALIAYWSIAVAANATHIIGGELFYSSLGNDDYEVTLKMFRDCNPNTNTNQTGFDPSVEIAAYDINGFWVSSSFFSLGTSSSVPVVLNNPCLTPPAELCVQEAFYSGVMHLPSGTGGYTLSFQRCCRSPAVINLANPQDLGLTCTVTVPDVMVSGANSSPSFLAYPPIALCLGQPMSFSNAATDPDGDLLVYDLCTPFTGGDNFNPIPSPPLGPPFIPVSWAPGYSQSNMIDASPALAIDANTGLVTLTPALQGSFAVAVRVREYRNSVLLSSVIRDFRFDVVPCVIVINSSITPQEDLVSSGSANTGVCDGLTVDMQNNSTGGDSYHWDFGVAGTSSDTSAEEEPSFTYPAAGTYEVTLVANPGWACADTSSVLFQVAPPVTVQFVPPPIACLDEQPMTLTASGDYTTAASIVWDLGTGTAPDADQHVAHATFPETGIHAVQVTVTENGCTDDFTDSVRVHPRPIPAFSVDTAGCIPLDVIFTNASAAWTPMTFAWEFGDGGGSTDPEPLHTYTTEGYHTVKLTVSTDSGCIATETLVRPGLVQVWPQPIARFMVEPPVADLMHPTVEVNDFSTSAYHWDFEVNGQHFDTTSFTYTFDDAGWYTVSLIAVSGLGCADTTSIPVFVGDHFFFAPTAFSPDGDGLNEVWLPSVKGARHYKLDVYDRWGSTVFSTTDPREGWDGAKYPVGIYSFKAWLTEWGPLEKEYNGSVTLIR